MSRTNHINLYMNLTFFGVDGFEKYRPMVHSLLNNVSDKNLVQFTLAINEAICNALRYGDGGVDISKVKVRLRCNSRFVIVKVSSSSPGFDIHTYIKSLDKSLEDDSPDWWEALKNKSHGRGIWIMLTGSEKVIFNNNGNDVILVSKIKDSAALENRELLSKITIRK
jgi:anti-sigma regulatory factor (Ser/Thr protein kinase)